VVGSSGGELRWKAQVGSSGGELRWKAQVGSSGLGVRVLAMGWREAEAICKAGVAYGRWWARVVWVRVEGWRGRAAEEVVRSPAAVWNE